MSKTKICKGCGAEIYGGAKKCPQCGKKNGKPIGLIILGVIILLIAISVISSNIKNSSAKKTKFTWPTIGIATLLPEPDFKYGKVILDSEDSFSVDIYFVSQDEYNDYVTSCKGNGFVVDYSSSDSYYSAEDENGNSLSLYYSQKNEEMSIQIMAYEEPEEIPEIETETEGTLEPEEAQDNMPEDENTDDQTDEPEEPEQTANEEENDADFRAWVDSYEEFMNEYVDFMVEYQNSDGTDVSLLTSYAEYMVKYAEFVEQSENVNSDDISAEEYAYYLEAYARITKRLAEIS
jgi:hypothetical protein